MAYDTKGGQIRGSKVEAHRKPTPVTPKPPAASPTPAPTPPPAASPGGPKAGPAPGTPRVNPIMPSPGTPRITPDPGSSIGTPVRPIGPKPGAQTGMPSIGAPVSGIPDKSPSRSFGGFKPPPIGNRYPGAGRYTF